MQSTYNYFNYNGQVLWQNYGNVIKFQKPFTEKDADEEEEAEEEVIH